MTMSYTAVQTPSNADAGEALPVPVSGQTTKVLQATSPQGKMPQMEDDVGLKAIEKKGDAKNRDEEVEPPDGGWGWFIVFANTICTMMMTTQGPCFGIFYGERLRELGASAALTTWLFNFQSLVWNLAEDFAVITKMTTQFLLSAVFVVSALTFSSLSPWAGLLGSKFSYRPVAMAAAFVASSSVMVSSCVSGNPLYFLLTFSLLSGIGGGICINSCYHMSAKYFKKRLGLANGIMVTGGSVGLIVMPLLASWLQEEFSFEWATIIAGCVVMLTVPATALFHPVEWHTKGTAPQSKEATSDATHRLLESKKQGSDTAYESGPVRERAEPEGIWKKFLNHYKPSVLRDPLVISTALLTCVSITTVLNVFSTVPFILRDAGYSLRESAWPMSVAALADLATRAACAAVVDYSWFNVRLLYAGAQIITILATNALVPSLDNYTMVLLTMGSLGIGLGIMYVLDVFIIIRVLGVDRMQSVFGISQLLRVFAFATLGPLGGVLREVTGMYDASIILYSCNLMLGVMLLLFTLFYTHFWTPKTDESKV